MAAARLPRQPISDELLSMSVSIRREAGVTAEQVQEAIDRYASRENWQERTGGIGFPMLEDIPQEHRPDFMTALAGLVPHPDRSRDKQGRRLSAADIWPSRIE
jgi:hypothetical protein